jgi:hypothetical protein
MDSDKNNDIRAFWYNVVPQSAKMEFSGEVVTFSPSLHIYGRMPRSSFSVRAEVFLADGKKVYDRDFSVHNKSGGDNQYHFTSHNGYFRLVSPVELLKQDPSSITVTIQGDGEKRSRIIDCRYHRLHGRVRDFEGNPFRAFIRVYPDGFGGGKGEPAVGVWCDQYGRYELRLPERTYNALYIDDESYRIRTLETWAWHIIMDRNQKLDFKVGTAEVYNMNVWPNNGGFNTFFISFRPMLLFPEEELNEIMSRPPGIELNGKEFILFEREADPLNLKLGNVTVYVNNERAETITLQKYYESGKKAAMPAYLVQVSRDEMPKNGKQTIVLEFKIEVNIGGKSVIRRGQGVYQLYLNFSGHSPYN